MSTATKIEPFAVQCLPLRCTQNTIQTPQVEVIRARPAECSESMHRHPSRSTIDRKGSETFEPISCGSSICLQNSRFDARRKP